MHQPAYELEGTYLMPWVRLHAIKDYLDMVLVLEKFPKLKLNFNIVPALLDSIIDYCQGYKDIHQELSEKDTDISPAILVRPFLFSGETFGISYRRWTWTS